MRDCLLLCPILAIAVGLPSQTVHLVGPTGFAQIRDAIAVAAAGDIIEVAGGTYAPFTAGVAVTIRRVGPTPVSVLFNAAFPEQFTTFSPPVGLVTHVIGIHFDKAPLFAPPIYTGVAVVSGRVTFDECSFISFGPPALEVDGATVHLQGCSLTGNNYLLLGNAVGTALYANQAIVTAVDSAMRAFQFGLLPSTRAVQLVNSTMQGSHLQLQSQLGPVLDASHSTVWLSDSALRVTGMGPINPLGAQLSRCTLQLRNGPITFVTGTTQLGVSRVTPIERGTNFTLDYQAGANQFVVILASSGLDTVRFGPLLKQPSWLDATAFSAALLLADGTGLASVTWPIPSTPSLVNQTLWLDGVSGLGFPLQVSPVVGGVVR